MIVRDFYQLRYMDLCAAIYLQTIGYCSPARKVKLKKVKNNQPIKDWFADYCYDFHVLENNKAAILTININPENVTILI